MVGAGVTPHRFSCTPIRNNMPERHKLRSRLKTSIGWRAYACQCSWESTEQLIHLQDRPRLTWVCGRHSH